MTLFDFIKIKAPELLPESAKIHLAVWTGEHDPLDVYLAGDFDDWQTWQMKKNFEYLYIVSLIQLEGANRWLFAGGSISKGCEWIEKKKGEWSKI